MSKCLLSQRYKDWLFIQGDKQESNTSGDLISRQAVFDAIEELKKIHFDRVVVLNKVRDRVLELPPVNPQEPTDTWSIKDVADTFKKHGLIVEQEPKTGHWIDNYNGIISCSNCHTWFYKDGRYSYMRYCPNCGCRMVEPQEKQCADCNHYGKLSLDCGRCDDDCSMYEPQESEDKG